MPDTNIIKYDQLALIRIETDNIRLVATLNPDATEPIQGEEYDSRWSIPRKTVIEQIVHNGFWNTWNTINSQVPGGISLLDGLTEEGALNFIGYHDKTVISCREQDAAVLLGTLPVGEYLFNIRPAKLKATNIDWDTDGEDVDLPTEIDIPEGMTDEDDISDYISDKTGFCHKGFTIETV